MDHHELARILIKIAGISIIIYVLVGLPAYISYYFSLRLKDDSILMFLLISILPMIIPLVAGYLMWQYPNTIANKIIKTKTDDNLSNSKLGYEIEVVAFSVLGMYLLFNAFGDFVYNFGYYLNYENVGVEGYTKIDIYALMFTISAEIIFACVLLFGGKNIVGILRKIRYGKENN